MRHRPVRLPQGAPEVSTDSADRPQELGARGPFRPPEMAIPMPAESESDLVVYNDQLC